MFDYEKLLYDSLLVADFYNGLHHAFKHKHLWVKKSTGLGVTEFFLRLMAWLCLTNNDYRNSQMCIVTGPNIDIAIKLIKRMKALFEPKLIQQRQHCMKDTLCKPRIASKWCDGNASIFTLFSSITVSFVSNVVGYLPENSFFIQAIITVYVVSICLWHS
jgi:hypothetical protein